MSGWQESQKEATPTSLHGMIRYKLEDQDHGDPQLNFPQEQVRYANEPSRTRRQDSDSNSGISSRHEESLVEKIINGMPRLVIKSSKISFHSFGRKRSRSRWLWERKGDEVGVIHCEGQMSITKSRTMFFYWYDASVCVVWGNVFHVHVQKCIAPLLGISLWR